MQDQFNEWYGAMEFVQNPEVRVQRWNALKFITSNPSIETLEVLVRLAFRMKPGQLINIAGQVRERFAEGGSPVLDEEATLLSAAALAIILLEKNSMATEAASMIIGASCSGLRSLKQPMDLPGMAICALNTFAETARRRPKIEQSKLTVSKIDISESLDALQDVSTASVRAAIEALAAATRQNLNSIASRQRSFENAVQEYVTVQDEELDILWWLLGKRCQQFDLPFDAVEPEWRPIVFAVELAALTKVAPGPTAVPSLLARAGMNEDLNLSIPDAVQGIPFDWLTIVLPEDRSKGMSFATTPILEAVRRRQEADGQDTWIPLWGTVTGIDVKTQLPVRQLAELLYRELLQVSL